MYADIDNENQGLETDKLMQGFTWHMDQTVHNYKSTLSSFSTCLRGSRY